MAGQNNLDRPGGLDEKQFSDKFNSRISREGKYQTKVRCASPRGRGAATPRTRGPHPHASPVPATGRVHGARHRPERFHFAAGDGRRQGLSHTAGEQLATTAQSRGHIRHMHRSHSNRLLLRRICSGVLLDGPSLVCPSTCVYAGSEICAAARHPTRAAVALAWSVDNAIAVLSQVRPRLRAIGFPPTCSHRTPSVARTHSTQPTQWALHPHTRTAHARTATPSAAQSLSNTHLLLWEHQFTCFVACALGLPDFLPAPTHQRMAWQGSHH